MSRLHFEGHDFELRADETVLDALLRQGVEYPYSCRSGVCQSCVMRLRRGEVSESAKVGLGAGARANGSFLGCLARCETDLEVARPSSEDLGGDLVESEVVDKRALATDVIALRLRPKSPFVARAGQYLSLIRPDGLSRAYSIASLPDRDGYLELHIRILRDGAMSGFVATKLEIGHALHVRGPAGECCYVPGTPEQPLLLVGTSTGLAPLLGVVRDALRHGHRGRISLIHGALDPAGLYARDELARIARDAPQLETTYSALRGAGGDPEILTTPLPQIIAQRWTDLGGHRVYLCGAPELVASLRRDAFLRGADFRQIHADAFLTRGSSSPHSS